MTKQELKQMIWVKEILTPEQARERSKNEEVFAIDDNGIEFLVEEEDDGFWDNCEGKYWFVTEYNF